MEEGQRLMEDELGYKQGYLVLILVVMEEGQRPTKFLLVSCPKSVLILVVMEEGQRPGKLSSPVDDTELS